ncbi:dTMP kinase [candidate division KSB1 bacterium]|nr:dTMP kinase [candidate division KSB1 bacterium]NIR69954.1 dTMP kinase [candidate division KSB1 bacterium]NIS25853.1 dTMP kinase [candidate division KSB1 bacterium]NIT72730.1 dTMP kinase [candidate division KSB1 bacterium]NIU26542.1 dTMP kinase [candidate division KSB1 bacterium]
MRNGFLINFEGIDFCGKSVQANLLKDRLQARKLPVLFLREPGGTEISEKIRDVLLNLEHKHMDVKTEVLLYSAARSQMVSECVIPHLNQGNIVICDRYYDSTTAYQGFGRQIDLDFIKKLHKFVTQGIVPDLTFLIDLKPEEAVKRKKLGGKKTDRLDEEHLEFYHRVREGYLKIARSEPDRFRILDGSQKIDDIHEKILHHVKLKLKEHSYKV